MRVLLIEDERRLAAVLKRGLEEENHTVSVAHDGRTGVEMAELYEFDVVVLDVMLPGMDGHQVARRLRSGGRPTPIVMLTARDTTPDVVAGLDAGADDYLKKPFAFDELLARLRAASRRQPSTAPLTLTMGPLTLDPATHAVVRDGHRLTLTATEFRLLEQLMRAGGRVVAREILIEAVWGLDSDIESNALDAFVRLLRRKVDDPFDPKLIHTVRGVGYALREGVGP
jgi:two-component system OmpR family response regulator